MPQFNNIFYESQIFWLAIAFLILFLYVSFVFAPKITKILQERKEYIESFQIKARKIEHSYEDLQQMYDDRFKMAHLQAANQLCLSEQQLEEKAETVLEQFRIELQDKENNLRDIFKGETQEVMKEIQPSIKIFAEHVAKRLLDEDLENKKL